MSDNFILEIGMEDIPHGVVDQFRLDTESLFIKELNALNLKYNGIKTYSTHRRIIVAIERLDSNIKVDSVSRKGMPLDRAYNGQNWTSMGKGFLKSLNINNNIEKDKIPFFNVNGENKSLYNDLFLLEEKSKIFLYLYRSEQYYKTSEKLSEIIKKIILSLHFKDSMRWGYEDILFIRPISYLFCLFGDRQIRVGIDGIVDESRVRSHRQIGKNDWVEGITVNNYFEKLKDHCIIYDQENRKKKILKQIQNIENTKGLKVVYTKGLLSDVSNLVEYPNAVLCQFDDDFLALPEELIFSQMIGNQFYFPCRDLYLNLTNRFVVVTNVQNADNVSNGYEKVLKARLSDALFLLKEDKKLTLGRMSVHQKDVFFINNILYKDKLKLVSNLLDNLKKKLKKNNLIEAIDIIKNKKIVDLYKADLSSKVVYEFPELQGIMGYYYLREIENEGVASVIKESYKPEGSHQKLPESDAGVMLSLCDKMSNLIICFNENLNPTGSRDPYALRRDALSIIRLLINKDISFDWVSLLLELEIKKEIRDKIWDFILTRFKKNFLNENVPDSVSNVIFSKNNTDINAINKHLQVLIEIYDDPNFSSLFHCLRRAKNFLREENIFKIDEGFFIDDSEREVYYFYLKYKNDIRNYIDNYQYKNLYDCLSRITPILNNMLDTVRINDDDADIKNNRISLLNKVIHMISDVIVI